MADNSASPPPSDRHRHAHRPAPSKRRRYVVLAGVTALVVAVIAVVLGVFSWDRSDDAVADQPVASPAASTTPTGPPATTPAPAPPPTPTPKPAEATPTPEVPVEFAGAMQQMGIPLDPHTGWVVAQGICVRLGQPSYDQFRMSEGVERLFPSVSDEQAHAFVAMVAESVCHV
jgi:hypothetical protein